MIKSYENQILICSSCSEQISKPVQISHERKSAIQFLGNYDWPASKDLKAPSEDIAVFGYADGWHHNHPEELWDDLRAGVWINLKDLQKSVETIDLRHAKYDYGCCGLDGWRTGPNRLCICGEFVGTEFSDCDTIHAFVPDNEKTKWQNVKS